MSVES
ncbi:type III secretion system apparatus protein, partial [Yersinia pestis PY-02]